MHTRAHAHTLVCATERTVPVETALLRTNYVSEGPRGRQHIDPLVLIAPCPTVACALILLRPGQEWFVRHHSLEGKCVSVHCRDKDIHIPLQKRRSVPHKHQCTMRKQEETQKQERERDRQRDRQTERQTERQRDRFQADSSISVCARRRVQSQCVENECKQLCTTTHADCADSHPKQRTIRGPAVYLAANPLLRPS